MRREFLTLRVCRDSKYRFMEQNAVTRKGNMTEKVPELQETIVMIEQLQQKVKQDPIQQFV